MPEPSWPMVASAALLALLVGYLLGRRRPATQTIWEAPPRHVDPGAEPEIDDLIRRGQKIAAIKRYRETHGTGLKEAKEAVEALERRLAGGA